ncbi:pulmonary surfactant-associated protein A-like isoform X2 [Hyla sarda]|nr:pulmonary surfactant-associated protein A-like isoform X2 [Hyla sarda]
MFHQAFILLTAVASIVACLPQPQNLEKLSEIPSITNPIPDIKANANIQQPTKGILAKIKYKGIPTVGNKPVRLLDLQRRISRLEAVLKLEEKIKVVGGKMIATSGKEVDFATSKSICNNVGGQIVTPMNEVENAAVLAFVKKYNRYAYLGVREATIPGIFNYINGIAAVYTHWRKGEPSGKGTEGCVEMYTDGQWNDKACNQNRLNICEL